MAKTLALLAIFLALPVSADTCLWPWATAQARTNEAAGATYQWEYSSGVSYTTTTPTHRQPCDATPRSVRVRWFKGGIASEWSDPSVEFQCMGLSPDRNVDSSMYTSGFLPAFRKGLRGCKVGG